MKNFVAGMCLVLCFSISGVAFAETQIGNMSQQQFMAKGKALVETVQENKTDIPFSEEEIASVRQAVIKKYQAKGITITEEQAAFMGGAIAGMGGMASLLQEQFKDLFQNAPAQKDLFEKMQTGELAVSAENLAVMYNTNTFFVDKTVKGKKILVYGTVKNVKERLYLPDGENIVNAKSFPAINLGMKFVGYINGPLDIDLSRIEPGQKAFLSCEEIAQGLFLAEGLCQPVMVGTGPTNNFNAWYINKERGQFFFGSN